MPSLFRIIYKPQRKVVTMNKLKLCIIGIAGVIGLSLIVFLTAGCGDDDPTNTPHELVGTWEMIQMIVALGATPIDTLTPGVDTVSGTATFDEDNTCTYNVDINHTFNTPVGPIPLDTAISSSGDWTSTDSSFTISDPQAGEQTFVYDITGNTMMTTTSMAIVVGSLTLIQTWNRQ